MKKNYITPELDIYRMHFGNMLEETLNDPLINGSGDENTGSQGGEFDGDLGG